jgi:peptidoglycan hydrolase-like protein with peptidoglycan-binding domain
VTLPPSGKLRVGDSGPAVVALQKALVRLGLISGKPDGDFGPLTEAAVAAFQRAHGLSPDGIVGAATAQKLNEALAGRPPG